MITALLYWVPGLLLLAFGLRKGLAYSPSSTARPVATWVSRNPQHEVWTSPFPAEPVPTEPRSLADFGVARIGIGVVLLACGVLAAFSVYPFAGDRAGRTTTVALPSELGGLARTASLDDAAQRAMATSALAAGLTQVDLAGYGAPLANQRATAFVFAGRGNLPLSKLSAVGDPLSSFHGPLLGSGLAAFAEGPGVAVPTGTLATAATCWATADTGLPGAVCRFTGTTFIVELLDVRAAGVEEVAAETRAAVAQIVRVRS